MKVPIMTALLSLAIVATEPLSAQGLVSFDAGIGLGSIGEGAGSFGRFSVGMSGERLGLLARVAGYDGAEGSGPGSFFGPPRETFSERGIMLTWRMSSETSTAFFGVGLGTLSGRRFEDGRVTGELVDLDATWGIPLEVSVRSGDGRGWSLLVFGSAHLNGEASHFGIGIGVGVGLGVGGGVEGGG